MDDIQRTICDAFSQNPNIVSDRQRLKSALADIIPTEKLMQNVILNAYDEDVVPKLAAGNEDIAMRALKLTRDLVDGYGLTDDSAAWAVSTWCYVIGHGEVADLIGRRSPNTVGPATHQPANGTVQYRQEYSFMSVYKAGKDFPSGTIQIIANGKLKNHCKLYVKDEPKFHWLKDQAVVSDFIEQAYVEIKDGQYLYTYVLDATPKFGYKIVKV